MQAKERQRALDIWVLFCVVLCVGFGAYDAEGEEFRLNEHITFTDRLHITGYGNIHLMDHEGTPKFDGERDLNDPLLQLRELSLFIDFDVAENIVASAEVGVANNLENQNLNYAYLDFDVASMIQQWDADTFGNLSVRAGRFLVPFLSYNENKPSFKQHLMSQPFTAWQLTPVVQSPPDYDGLGWSDTGIMLNWSRLVGDSGVVDFKLAIIKGLQSNEDVFDANSARLDTGLTVMGKPFQPTVRPRDGLAQNEASNDFHDNNGNKAVVLKSSYSFIAFPLDVGFSWYRGAWDNSGDQFIEMYGPHFNYLARRWTLKGEYVRADVEQTGGINIVTQMGPAAINTSTDDYNMLAWYLEGSAIPFFYGAEDGRYVRLIARYDDVDTNDEAAFTPWDRSRVTLGTEWQFCSNARLRYEWQQHTIHSFSDAPSAFKAAGGKKHIDVHMVSAIFWF